jgi:hypothetical protein
MAATTAASSFVGVTWPRRQRSRRQLSAVVVGNGVGDSPGHGDDDGVVVVLGGGGMAVTTPSLSCVLMTWL